MPQAARVVSRVFLDDVASVVNGTAKPRPGYVSFRGTAPTGSAASAVFLRRQTGPLPVEHKRGKTASLGAQPGRFVTRWTPAAAGARIKRALDPAEPTCTANPIFEA